MKVVEQTQTRLALSHQPIRAWAIAGVAAATALFNFFAWLGEPASTQLKCQRLQPNYVICQLQRTAPIGFKSYQTINNVASVNVASVNVASRQSSSRRSRRTQISFLTLVTPSQQVKISNSERRTDTATQIQAFLSNPRSTTLAITYSRSLHALEFIAIGFLIVMIIGLFSMPKETYIFYRSLQKLVIVRKGIFGKQEYEYALNDIDQVSVEKQQTRRGTSYYIALWLSDGQQIKLPPSLISSERVQLDLAHQIRRFLHGYTPTPE